MIKWICKIFGHYWAVPLHQMYFLNINNIHYKRECKWCATSEWRKIQTQLNEEYGK